MTVPQPLDRPPEFPDPESAGRTLAARMERLRAEAPVVLAISRGGLPVAHQAARSLGAPLDVLVVRRVGEPGRWVGAVAEDGTAVIDHDLALLFGTSPAELSEERERAEADAAERARFYRGGREPLPLAGRTAVLSTTPSPPGPRRSPPRGRCAAAARAASSSPRRCSARAPWRGSARRPTSS